MFVFFIVQNDFRLTFYKSACKIWDNLFLNKLQKFSYIFQH